MANCYTVKNKLPKTTSACLHSWPKLESYHTRRAARLDPQWGGRQNYPGTTPYRPFIDRPEMRFNPPPFEEYRVRRMDAMLKQINFCNWSTSQKAMIHETRDKALDLNEIPKAVTTTRHFFKDYSHQRPPESCRPARLPVLGTLPGMHARAYSRHLLYTWPDYVENDNKDKKSQRK